MISTKRDSDRPKLESNRLQRFLNFKLQQENTCTWASYSFSYFHLKYEGLEEQKEHDIRSFSFIAHTEKSVLASCQLKNTTNKFT